MHPLHAQGFFLQGKPPVLASDFSREAAVRLSRRRKEIEMFADQFVFAGGVKLLDHCGVAVQDNPFIGQENTVGKVLKNIPTLISCRKAAIFHDFFFIPVRKGRCFSFFRVFISVFHHHNPYAQILFAVREIRRVTGNPDAESARSPFSG